MSATKANFRTLKFLLDTFSPVHITQEVLVAAAGNEKSRLELVELLLTYEFEVADLDNVIPLTEETTIACASNLAHARDLMEMLLEHNMTDWPGKAALTTLFCETLVHRGNFRCLKSLLDKVGDLCIDMEVYEFGLSPRIDVDLVEKLLEFCDDDLINYDLIYKVVSGAYHEDDLSFVQKLLPRLQPGSFSGQSIYRLAARRREGAAQMLRLLQTEGFNTVVERETVLTAVRSSSVDVLFALDFAKWSFKCDEEVL